MVAWHFYLRALNQCLAAKSFEVLISVELLEVGGLGAVFFLHFSGNM